MAILLDHLIVPSHNPVASAQSLADILAVPWEAERGHFTPVYVNETLTLDFAEREQFDALRAQAEEVRALPPNASADAAEPIRWQRESSTRTKSTTRRDI